MEAAMTVIHRLNAEHDRISLAANTNQLDMNQTMKRSNTRLGLIVLTELALLLPQLARADYRSAVLADAPQAYYRFNDNTARTLINNNSGSLGAAGNASNDLAFVTGGIVHPMPGAIAGDSDQAEFFDYTTRTEVPFNAAYNPPNTQPFTVESWIYPVSDQASTGMGVWCNRYTQGATRQGWVMYQRGANTNTSGFTSGPGVGWEFRMYNNQDTSGHLDVTSGVPFTLGKWQHVAVVYDPVFVTNATLTIYVDGVAANTNIWAVTDGVTPGYYPNQNTNAVQPNGPPALSLGGYNNANGGNYGFENPWTGGINEFALYSAKLTPAQILAHYQSGTNANRTQSYSSLILSNNPVLYLRLDERAPSPDVAVNFGDDRGSATGTNTADVKHPAFSALAGRTTGGAASYHQRNGSSTTDIPWLADNNPNAGVPFTFESWLRPTSDRQNPGAAPVNNRYVSSGNRTGWVIFQRAPNTNYSTSISGYSGVGWTFRMYSGEGSSGQDVLTDVGYNVGEWQHLVVTWEPTSDNGDQGNGNDQWVGVLTAYVDGFAVVTNASALYAANVNPTEDSTAPADFAVGSYNAASGLGSNPFEGDVDHLAFYNNAVLTPDQILAHYQAGTNSTLSGSYESLVFNAGGELYLTNSGAPIPEGTTIPKLYLTFNDPAPWPVTNSGTVGFIANGNQVNTSNTAPGPQPPAYAGFEASNTALPVNGTISQWASFNNPSGLNITGQISLEAWVQPAATQTNVARILSHGPQTISSYEAFVGTVDPGGSDFIGATTNTTEVFLRIDGSGANYSVGSAQYNDGTGSNYIAAASYPVPAGDLGGSAWVHLVGTYDGANWKLYRNGKLVASQASPTGALPVDLGDWAVGSTGEGWMDNFNGAIDEVAIYNTALSASKVATHYVTGKAGTAAITVTPAGGDNVTITWPAGTTLVQSTTVNGAYAPVSGLPVSPLTVTASGTMFYRWEL